MRFGRFQLAIATAAALLAGRAGADVITATVENVSPSQIVGITYNGNYLGQAYAGLINWQGQASNLDGLGGSFSTFCIDLTQDIYLGGTYTYTVTDLSLAPNPLPPTAPQNGTGMGTINIDRLNKLYSMEYDSIASDSNASDRNDRGAAFQIAMWEILYETSGTNDVTSGTLSVSGASSHVVSLANQFVCEAISPGADMFHNDLLAIVSPSVQDQIIIGPPSDDIVPGRVVVPTPAAAMGAVPLLGGLALGRRHKRKSM